MGKNDFSKNKNIEDIKMLMEQQSVYILAVHTITERINPLLDSLMLRGKLTVVQNHYNTPLYYYSKTTD